MHEQRRHVDVALEQAEIRRFERCRGEQARAKAQPDRVVLARVLVLDRSQRVARNSVPRMGEQRLVQGDLAGRGFAYRRQLGPQQI